MVSEIRRAMEESRLNEDDDEEGSNYSWSSHSSEDRDLADEGATAEGQSNAPEVRPAQIDQSCGEASSNTSKDANSSRQLSRGRHDYVNVTIDRQSEGDSPYEKLMFRSISTPTTSNKHRRNDYENVTIQEENIQVFDPSLLDSDCVQKVLLTLLVAKASLIADYLLFRLFVSQFGS